MNEAELFERVERERTRVPGWCSAEKARKLVRAILTLKPALAVEIGVFGGSSLIPQALALKHLGRGIVHGIDPWKTAAALEEMQEQVHIDWWSRSIDLDEIGERCIGHLRRLDLAGYYELERAKAEDVVDRFPDGGIGLLHIDGNHSETLSMKDATLYLPKVAPGGCIFFDDVSWTEHSVRTTHKALTYLLQHGCVQVDQTGDCAILCKQGDGQ